MIVSFVLMLTVLLGCCALALDIGLFQLKVLQMQNAADAAALGGMHEMERNNSANWRTLAMAESAQNGFTQGVGGTTLTLTNAPTGTWSNDNSAVQAVVTQPASFAFAGILRANALTLAAKSIAYAAPCAYFTSNTLAYPSLWFASNQAHSTCPVYVNSWLVNDGFASSYARAWRIAGPQAASVMPANTNPTPYWNVPALTDPLAWITAPSFQSCTPALMNFQVSMSGITLNPGTYCGGITDMGFPITLNPGLYIITGGVNIMNTTVTGTGVTLYMTKRPTDMSYGQFNVQSSILNLSAPTTNALNGVPGIVIFGDRNWIPTSSKDFIMNYSSFYGDGIWYTSHTGVYMWDGAFMDANGGADYCGIVTDNMYVYLSDVKWSANYSSLPAGNPFRPRGTLVQ